MLLNISYVWVYIRGVTCGKCDVMYYDLKSPPICSPHGTRHSHAPQQHPNVEDASMDHLHGRFILVHILTYCVISGEVMQSFCLTCVYFKNSFLVMELHKRILSILMQASRCLLDCCVLRLFVSKLYQEVSIVHNVFCRS